MTEDVATAEQLIGKQLRDGAGHTLNVTAVTRDGDRWQISGTADCPTDCPGPHRSGEEISAWTYDHDPRYIFGWEQY